MIGKYWKKTMLPEGVIVLYLSQKSLLVFLFGKTRQGEIRIPDRGWTLIHNLTENRLRCACGPVYFHSICYIDTLTQKDRPLNLFNVGTGRQCQLFCNLNSQLEAYYSMSILFVYKHSLIHLQKYIKVLDIMMYFHFRKIKSNDSDVKIFSVCLAISQPFEK